jgi:hypothetical protein
VEPPSPMESAAEAPPATGDDAALSQAWRGRLRVAARRRLRAQLGRKASLPMCSAGGSHASDRRGFRALASQLRRTLAMSCERWRSPAEAGRPGPAPAASGGRRPSLDISRQRWPSPAQGRCRCDSGLRRDRQACCRLGQGHRANPGVGSPPRPGYRVLIGVAATEGLVWQGFGVQGIRQRSPAADRQGWPSPAISSDPWRTLAVSGELQRPLAIPGDLQGLCPDVGPPAPWDVAEAVECSRRVPSVRGVHVFGNIWVSGERLSRAAYSWRQATLRCAPTRDHHFSEMAAHERTRGCLLHACHLCPGPYQGVQAV